MSSISLFLFYFLLFLHFYSTHSKDAELCVKHEIIFRGRDLITLSKGQLILVLFTSLQCAQCQKQLRKLSSIAETLPEVRFAVLAPSNEPYNSVSTTQANFPRLLIDKDSGNTWNSMGFRHNDEAIFDKCGRLSRVIKHPRSDLNEYEDTIDAVKAATSHAICGWCNIGSDSRRNEQQQPRQSRQREVIDANGRNIDPLKQVNVYMKPHTAEDIRRLQMARETNQYTNNRNSQYSNTQNNQYSSTQNNQHSNSQNHPNPNTQSNQYSNNQNNPYGQYTGQMVRQQQPQGSSRIRDQLLNDNSLRMNGQDERYQTNSRQQYRTPSWSPSSQSSYSNPTPPPYITPPPPIRHSAPPTHLPYTVSPTLPINRFATTQIPYLRPTTTISSTREKDSKSPKKESSFKEEDYDYDGFESKDVKATEPPVETQLHSPSSQRFRDPSLYPTAPLSTVSSQLPYLTPAYLIGDENIPCAAYTDDICYNQQEKLGHDQMSKCCLKRIYFTDVCLPGKCSNSTIQLCCMQKFLQSRYACCHDESQSEGSTATDKFNRCCYDNFAVEDDCCPPSAVKQYWSSSHDLCLPNTRIDLSSVKMEVHFTEGVRVLDLSQNTLWNHECPYGKNRVQYAYVP